MIVIHTNKLSLRLDYTCKLLFKELLGLDFRIETERNSRSDKEFHISYGVAIDFADFVIEKVILLDENNIRMVPFAWSNWRNQPALLLDNSKSFDLFAAVFYLVSRYEEYLPFKLDAHNRFPATESCLLKGGVLDKPLVNIWAMELWGLLKQKFPNIAYKGREFEYQSTIDIDQAWKYKNKGVWRSFGGLFRDIKHGDWSLVKERIKVHLGFLEDPFFNFDWQYVFHGKHSINVKYLIQVGDLGRFDKNCNFENKQFLKLIEQLDSCARVGLHPSYQSNKELKKLKKEYNDLSQFLGRKIDLSRQHFLIHKMPTTYQNLVGLGIKEEHTMGYTSHSGFRAGIAAPFYFFDLEKNERTNLKLIPFCSMDITPRHYNKWTIDESIERTKQFMYQVKEVNGLFVSLWHNESLSNSGVWKNWRKLYIEICKNSQ